MIYFVRCSLTEMVKIGRAGDPHKRIAKIQSDSPGHLTLLGVEDGDAEREAELHAEFARCRVRGEWFLPDAALSAYLAQLETPERGRRIKRLGGKLGAWMADNGVSCTVFAKDLGASKATVSMLCSGKVMPSWPMMLRIAQITGGSILPNDFIPTDFTVTEAPKASDRVTLSAEHL